MGRDVLTRPRLFNWLEDNLPEIKLGLVVSQAGSGKTTLLVDFARRSDLPTAWLSLDPLDNDLHRFCAYFVGSLTIPFPHFGEQSASFLRHTADLAQNLDAFVTVLVNDIVAHIQEHFVLVLDDYHLVNDNVQVNDFLARYLTHASENSHIALLTRTLPHLPIMPLLITTNEVLGFDFDELAFTAVEVQSYWSQTNFTLTDSQLDTLLRRTRGWITGVRLAEMGDAPTATPPAFLGTNQPDQEQRLDQYFERQVWQMQSPALREALLLTAVPDTFNESLCTAVFGDLAEANWADLLEEMTQRNLFLVRVGERGESLRYQDLFRDFLRRKLGRERPQDTAVWRHKLADYYRDQGEWLAAFALYDQLQQASALAQALQQAWDTLAPQGQYATLAYWLAQLPQQTLKQQPSLLAKLGLARFNSQHKESTTELDEAVHRLREQQEAHPEPAPDRRDALGWALAWRAIQREHRGHPDKALQDTAEAITLAATPSARQGVFWLAEAYRVRGLVLWRRGAYAEALTALQQAQTLFANGDEGHHYQERGLAMTVGMMGKVYRAQGDYAQAEACYQEAYGVWARLGDRHMQADMANSLGVLCHSRAQFLRAEGWFETAWQLAQSVQQVRLTVYALTGLGDLYVDLGAWEAAEQVYARAEAQRTAVQDAYLANYVSLRCAEMARWRGAGAEGARFLAQAERVQARDNQQKLALETLLWRWHQYQTGEPASLDVAAELRALPAPGQEPLLWLWAAWVVWQAGQTAHTLSCLKQMLAGEGEAPTAVLSTAVRLGDAWTEMAQEFSPALPALRRFQQALVSYQARVMQVRRELRQKTLTVPLGPPQLTIHTLGRYEILRNGEPVVSSAWLNQTLVRKLLALLLVHPHGITKEQIGLILWPDATPKELTSKLRNVKYKLGLAVGDVSVTRYDSATALYRFNWDLDYLYDVFQVRHYTAEGRSHGRESAWRQVLHWYQGEFLPEFDEDVFVNERPLLMEIYQEALRHTAVLAEQRGDTDQAEQDWLALFATDTFMTSPVERLMHLYKRTRQRRKILDIYQQHVAAMDELGLPPEPDITQLQEQLLRF